MVTGMVDVRTVKGRGLAHTIPTSVPRSAFDIDATYFASIAIAAHGFSGILIVLSHQH